MTAPPRPPRVLHSTSQPFRFFGRTAELALLEEAFHGGPASVLALIGPGGQGKTAILQQWLHRFLGGDLQADGVFLWSFYRGKDADLCLHELYAYATGVPAPDVSASYCVDHLLPLLHRERWALLLDGTEVVQYEGGDWFGRFLHPELGRLLDELASEPMPGVVVLTTRFPIPGLEHRRHARLLSLGGLDAASSRGLLGSLGVRGSPAELDAAAAVCGCHAKAVELLATYLARFANGEAGQIRHLPEVGPAEGYSPEERQVVRILAAFQAALPQEAQDVLALATAFRDPPEEVRLREYLLSEPVHLLLHQKWGRPYVPFADRPPPPASSWRGGRGWLEQQIQELIDLRLLERVGDPAAGTPEAGGRVVIDAHPLVRRGFEHVLGEPGRRQSAQSRAGFLRGRPDRRRPGTLEQAREEVELFHSYCDAHLWNEADGVLVALDNPKHRFLAPAFERDLLLRFFAEGDWRRPPLWPGFGRYRSLAICFELLGDFEDALAAYRAADWPLRGDALIALGRLDPLLDRPQAPAPWQALWHAYRCHALCLAGHTTEALTLARSLVPVDVYEWVHVFECLLRTGELRALDLGSVLFRPPHAAEHRWGDLARRRLRADYLRRTTSPPPADLGVEYEELLEAYDRGGLPWERALLRLSYARWLLERDRATAAQGVNALTLELARRHGMRLLEADAWEVAAEIDGRQGDRARWEAARIRAETGYRGPGRP
jgi:hypothetical protein